LLFVTYCIQKCQKCCKIVRDRVPSLKKVRERRSPAFPPHYTTASNALLASYKVAHRIAKCKEPHTISELIPSIAVDMGNLMIGESAELSALALMKSKYRLKINVEKKTFILIQRIEKTCGKSGSSIPQIIVMQFVESAHFQLV